MGSVTDNSKNVALVFGASGISGWAVFNNLFTYPTPTSFSRIIGLTNRPMDLETSRLPTDDPRFETYSGVNLRGDLNEVKEQLKEKVPNLDQVTHMYYCAYSNASAYSVDVMEIRNINVHMTGNAVHATDELCPNLKFLTLQTGTNAYGVAVFRFQDKIEINPPLKESMPRVPSPYGDEIFYYPQADLIKEAAKGKSWKWCEIRPDAIVGFVPGTTGMTFLEPVALFLSLYRYVNGPDAEIKHLGTWANYIHKNTDSYQDIIAKTHLYLSVEKPDEANGEAYNTADNDIPTSWETRWPKLVSYFGLKGVAPDEGVETVWPADKWWQEHQEDYKKMCDEYNLRPRDIPPESWTFMLYAGFGLLARDRHFDLSKLRSTGFKEEMAVCEGHFLALDRMVAERILPASDAMKKGSSM